MELSMKCQLHVDSFERYAVGFAFLFDYAISGSSAPSPGLGDAVPSLICFRPFLKSHHTFKRQPRRARRYAGSPYTYPESARLISTVELLSITPLPIPDCWTCSVFDMQWKPTVNTA